MFSGTTRSAGRLRGAALAAALLAIGSPAHALILDPNFVETELEVTAIDAQLTGMAWAPDGTQRLFLTRKGGEVSVIENGEVRDEPFAVLSPLFGQSECGLLAVAFDPDFVTNHYVYFFLTVSSEEQRIVRFRDDQSIGADPTTIVSGLPTRGANHDGGALAFGPDGKLYWAVGDLGGQVGVGADLASPAAKVGRANRDGTLPEGNPFADGPGPNYDFTWARGFRNPFSMTFDPAGRLWLNVVGTNYEQVFAVGAGDHGGYADTESLRSEEFLSPLISYRTNGTDSYSVPANGATRSGGVATFSTTTPHWLRLGELVTISGTTDATFNGAGFVTGVPAPDRFTIEQAGANATSGGGSVTTAPLGGCVTGGTFLDSTTATPEYGGNFFFGDYNIGSIARVRVSGTTVTSVEPWATDNPGMVDIDVGPDGDLYYVSYIGNGIVHHAEFLATSQRLVVSRTNVRMLEAGRAAFHVRLAMEPPGDVSVSIARASGDRDVAITGNTALTFDVTDWQTPKPVFMMAARDADGTDDLAELSVSASGLGEERVSVYVIDEFDSAEPPGEGGQAGAGGEPPAGAGGVAGEAQGGVSGSQPQGGGGGVRDPGDAGQAGDGEDGGESGSAPSGQGGSDGGCSCAMSRSSAHDLAWLGLVALLLHRRARRGGRDYKGRGWILGVYPRTPSAP